MIGGNACCIEQNFEQHVLSHLSRSGVGSLQDLFKTAIMTLACKADTAATAKLLSWSFTQKDCYVHVCRYGLS